MTQFGELDVTRIRSIPEKRGGYRLSYYGNKIRVTTPIISIPFGFETYQKKEILNLLIDDDDNDKHNFIHYITELEQYLQNPKYNMHPNYNGDINNKTFINTLRKNNNNKNYILRINAKNSDNVDIRDKNGKLVFKHDIIHKNCKCIIELSNVWIYGDNYGLVWNLSNIIVE